MLEPNQSLEHDLALVAAARRMDARAIDELVGRLRCVPLIVTALNARLGRPLDAHELNDVSQEALMLIWQRLSAFEGRSSLEGWVYRFCSYTLLNVVRKRRRARLLLEPEADSTDTAGPEEPLAWAEFDDVHSAIERLKDDERACVRLKHFGDWTFEEIGERLKISPNTAKTQYYRGLRKLRELLGAREGEFGR